MARWSSPGCICARSKHAKGPTTYEFTVKATDKSTNQSTSQTVKLQQRHVIEVTSNAGDTSEGSFGWAVQQANQLGAKNIACEIRFKESMTIESKNGYKLTHGDVKINTYDSKNISIKRTSNGSAFTIGEKRFATKNSTNEQPNLKVEASNINVYGTEAKGGDAAKDGGGGGGMGTGAGILHFNGHVAWSNSVFQENKVVGGEGAEKPKAGAKPYTVAGNDRGSWGWASGTVIHKPGTNGSDGLRGGGMNEYPHSFGSRRVKGGRKADAKEGQKGTNNGSNGSDAPDAEGLAEGGNGPAAGGAPDWSNPSGWSYYSRNYGPMGKPGKYGKKGKANYGGGEAVGPGDGTAPWGGKADKNKGGHGSAMGGAISSFAQKNEKNSFTLRDTDALNNKAESSDSAGKIKNIHSRHIDIKIDNYRQSDQVVEDRNRTAVTTGTQNTDPSIDRQQDYNNSAKFIKAEAKDPTGITVRANSYIVKTTEAYAVGETIKLDPTKSHAIFSGMEMNTKDIAALEVNGWQQWRNATMSMAGKVYATKTEAEIRASRKGFFDTWGGLGIKYAGKLPGMSYLGDGVNLVKGIVSEFAEEERIQKELKNREATIAEHTKIKRQFQGGLTIDRFEITDIRTQPRLDGFSLGKHTNDFQPGIDPVLAWQGIQQGRANISIAHRDLANKTDDSKAKKFQTIVLTKEQTEEMKGILDVNKYLNSFVQYKETKIGGQIFRHARIATQSEWAAKKNLDPTQGPSTGAGNDRIVIQRDYGTSGINVHTNLTVYTHQGDDIIQGDEGRSSIYAGRGNDSITPGLGVDYVDGGEGRDIVNYSNVSQALKAKAQADGTVKIEFANVKEEGIMDDTIKGVEGFVFKENAVINFKNATRPVEYSANDPKRTTNKESYYAFSLKQGTNFEGSEYDDKIELDFEAKEDSSIKPNSIKKVSIDGRGGRNTLIIKGVDSWVKQGYEVIHDQSNKEVKIRKENEETSIVKYKNIMGSPDVTVEGMKIIEMKNKAMNIASMDVDEDLDALTNYRISKELSHIQLNEISGSDQLIMQNGDSSFNGLVPNLELETIIQGMSATQDPIKMILGDTSNSLEVGSNRHQQRDPLTQERIDNF